MLPSAIDALNSPSSCTIRGKPTKKARTKKPKATAIQKQGACARGQYFPRGSVASTNPRRHASKALRGSRQRGAGYGVDHAGSRTTAALANPEQAPLHSLMSRRESNESARNF
jgi:hypothetical protein